jgi:hypothetical protein
LQQEISSLTQRRKESNSASRSYLVNIVLTAKRAKTERTKKSWRLSVFALSLVAALPLCDLAA